jgi:hypothetical protein
MAFISTRPTYCTGIHTHNQVPFSGSFRRRYPPFPYKSHYDLVEVEEPLKSHEVIIDRITVRQNVNFETPNNAVSTAGAKSQLIAHISGNENSIARPMIRAKTPKNATSTFMISFLPKFVRQAADTPKTGSCF